LPNINELRSLFRSGAAAACQPIEWDMLWTEQADIPSGYCGVWDDGCLDNDTCWVGDECAPSACVSNGCYWDAALGGTCFWYWSSSEETDDTYAWSVDFEDGNVEGVLKALGGDPDAGPLVTPLVRCVRTGP
jgi:hypothetical protein